MANCIDRSTVLKEVERDRIIAKTLYRGIDNPIDVMFDAVKDSIMDAPEVSPTEGRIGITELIYQSKRMCKSHNERCTKCPLRKYLFNNLCIYRDLIFNNQAEDAAKEVARWVAEHPEPQYPTWGEWFKETFPNGNIGCFSPAAFYAKSCEDCRACNDVNYYVQPIPADIAVKLGIPPKGAKE